MKIETAMTVSLLFCAAVWAQSSPVDQGCIRRHSSNFGAQGDDYDGSSKVWHCGDDIGCEYMTPVFSPVNGRIVGGSPTGWDSPSNDKPGLRSNFALKINSTVHGRPTLVVLGHLMRPLKAGQPVADQTIVGYRIGEEVRAGDAVGFIGKWSVGTHLHLAVAVGEPFPKEGFGRQPLPRPAEQSDQGVKAFGIWRDPLPWLGITIISPMESGVDNFLPATTTDGTGFYFVRDDASGQQQLTLADTNGNAIMSVSKLPTGERALDIFPGPGSDVFAKSQSVEGFSLWRLSPGRAPDRLVLADKPFECSDWFSEADYLPIRLGRDWQAVDLATGKIRRPSELLPAEGKLWQLIGSSTNNGQSKAYLARYIVGPKGTVSESALYEDGTASLESLCILPLQPEHSEWNESTKEVVWLRKDMSGCSIWRSLLCSGMSLLGCVAALEIPYYDENWTKCTYSTTREIMSLTVVGCQAKAPRVVFDERVSGRFVIRSMDLAGKKMRDLVR